MTDVSPGTSCTVFFPQVICLNKDLPLSQVLLPPCISPSSAMLERCREALLYCAMLSKKFMVQCFVFLEGFSSPFCFSKEFTLVKVNFGSGDTWLTGYHSVLQRCIAFQNTWQQGIKPILNLQLFNSMFGWICTLYREKFGSCFRNLKKKKKGQKLIS